MTSLAFFFLLKFMFLAIQIQPNASSPNITALYIFFYQAHVLKSNGYLNELVDRRLGSNFDQEEVMVMINVAFLCTHPSSSCRPTMSSVLSMLEGKTVVPELNSDKTEETNMMKLEEMRQYYRDIEESQMSEADNHNHTKSLLGPSTGSSTSAADLYPIRLDSSFWDGRN